MNDDDEARRSDAAKRDSAQEHLPKLARLRTLVLKDYGSMQVCTPLPQRMHVPRVPQTLLSLSVKLFVPCELINIFYATYLFAPQCSWHDSSMTSFARAKRVTQVPFSPAYVCNHLQSFQIKLCAAEALEGSWKA